MGLLAVVALLAAVVVAIFWPLLTTRRARGQEHGEVALEITRDAKLAELNELELDFRLGKLSAEDYATLNATLRSEAVEIIRQGDASARNGRRAAQRSRRR